MNNFSYTNIHIFNKKGIELPFSFKSTLKLTIKSPVGDDAIYYGVLDNDYNMSFKQIKPGGRFIKPANKNVDNNPEYTYTSGVVEIIGNQNPVIYINDLECKYVKSLSSSTNQEYDIVDILDYKHTKEILLDNVENNEIPGFPSLTFQTSVNFNEVSVDLVETESLYVLYKTDNNEFDKVGSLCNLNSINYDILFFLDNRSQSDFRFFNAKDDELEWSNKIILDLSKNDFRVNIGFNTSIEGLYEQDVFVCLVDKLNEDNIYPIGSIKLNAEAIGEDERYRTLFTNFNLPDPDSLHTVFNNTNNLDDKPDFIKYNKNAKKLFLSYSEIFPYVGTYKALINAINVLGYSDIFFKEWYKEIGKSKDFDAGYVTYDITHNSDDRANSIMNIDISERVKLKKLNWISMFYRINEELASENNDEYGFPYSRTVYGFNDTSIIPKIISLKKWLEKYVIGVNCRIIDVGGEGIFFERYHIDAYGSFQESKEWNNVKNLAPSVNELETTNVLSDSSTYINVNVSSNDIYKTLEDFNNIRFIDLIDGYINENGIYHSTDSAILDKQEQCVFVGSTIENNNLFESYELRASSKVSDFLFNDDYLFTSQNYEKIDSSIEFSSSLRLHDNTLKFSPYDLYRGYGQHAIFTKLPVIKIERANIRLKNIDWNSSLLYKINVDTENEAFSYKITNYSNNNIIGTSNDYINLIPPTYELSEDNLNISLTPWKSNKSFKFERFTNYKFDSDNIFDDSFDGSTCTPVETYLSDNTTFGLRYSNDNIYHLPMFLIKGYQFDCVTDSNKNINPESEFILEILDGKMIFRDENHGRMVYLNFNFDTKSNKQTIEVNFEYFSDNFSIVKYENSYEHFIEGKNYTSFYNSYLNENLNDDLIGYNTTHSIKVYNSGKFTIDVYAKDMHNNIFAAKCKNFVNVITPDVNLITYSNTDNGHGEIIADTSEILSNFIDFCIYDTNYIIPNFTKIVNDGKYYYQDSSLLITYPSYSYSIENPQSNDYINFINIKDRWKVIGLDSYFPNVNSSDNESSEYKNYSLVLKKNSYHNYIDVINEHDNDAIHLVYNENMHNVDSSIFNATKFLYEDDNEYTFTNTNVIYYNELGGYPICQTYGQIANDKAFNIYNNTYSGNYKLAVKEQDDRSYIWSSLKALSKNNIKDDLINIQKIVLSQYDILDITSLDKYEFAEQPDYNYESLRLIFSNRIIDVLMNTLHDKTYSVVLSEDDINNYFLDKLRNTEYIETSFINEEKTYNALNTSLELFEQRNETYICNLSSMTLDKIYDLFDFSSNLYAFENISSNNDIDAVINDSSVFESVVNYYDNVYNGIKRKIDFYNEVTDLINEGQEISMIYDFILKKDLLSTKVFITNSNKNRTIGSVIIDYLTTEFILDDLYVKAIIKALFSHLKEFNVDILDNYVDSLNNTFNLSFYENVFDNVLSACKKLNTLFNNIDSFIIPGDVKNLTLINYIHNIIKNDNEYSKLKNNKDFNLLLSILCNSLIDVNNDDETKLNSYVCLAYTIFIYITEQLIENTKFVLQNAVLVKTVNDNTYKCGITNLLSLFILATEPTLHVNLLNNTLASLEGQRYFLFKNAVINNLDNSIFENIIDKLNDNVAIKSLYTNFVKGHDMYNDMLLNYVSNENDVLVKKGYVTKGHISLMSNDINQDVLYACSANEYKLEVTNNTTSYTNNFDSNNDYSYTKVEDNLIYIKTSEYVNDGKKHVNDVDNRNVMPNVKSLLSSDYISLYTRPSWNIDVLVQELDDDTINAIHLDSTLPEMDEDTGMKYYLITYISTAYAPKLQVGDVIKLSFKNFQTNEYYGAASYTIACKTSNAYMYIITGKINEEFLFNIKDRNIWVPGNFYQKVNSDGEIVYIYDEDASKQFIGCSTNENQISYVKTLIQNESGNSSNIYANVKYIDMISDLSDANKENIFMYDIKKSKDKFYDSSLNSIQFNDDTYKLFVKQVYVVTNTNKHVPITVKNESISERINMKMSYSNNMFVNYPMKINESVEDIFGITTLCIENSKKNKAYLDFIDNTYGLTINKFNINEGLHAWMNYSKNENNMLIPNIALEDLEIYKNVNSSISVTQNKSYVCFSLDSIPDTSYVYWKVYRMIDNLNEHRFMFESYNPYLYLDYKDKGIYDIEAYVYDKFGNLNKHMYKGAYIIK